MNVLFTIKSVSQDIPHKIRGSKRVVTVNDNLPTSFRYGNKLYVRFGSSM